jgi:tRNA (adenine22-N1)-methyltransferase
MLSKRLQAIASFIKPTDKVIDIGCDHGYLGLYLLKNNICQKVLLTDNKIKALKNAQTNALKYQVIVPTLLSDGLTNVNYEDYNTITISGMGSNTILKILKPLKTNNAINKIIIQSNNDLAILRKEIIKMGYYLAAENTVLDKGIWYVICEFKKGQRKVSKVEILFGLPNINKKAYYQSLLIKSNELLKVIPHRQIRVRIKLIYQQYLLKKLLKESR